MTDILFILFAVVAVGGAVGVVIGRSPVASLLFMVATLASVAGIYVLFEAHFLAAIQVLVYAGAIMVLFLFVIMLLNLGHDYRADLRYGSWSLLSLVVVGLTAGVLMQGFSGDVGADLLEDGAAAAAAIDAAVIEKGAVGVIADPLFTDYVVAFELMGLLLLVAIVAAVVLAKPRGSGEG
ncbi:MAG: NADH-quinone oxidoreductase subunit J [Gemmatimonadetes bacterium]|nr:NADH-quinone oxidoreductase subunit J [Gemmatimonadota bacterium]MCY3676956.1 NADH-quinone oxidoreductase subunit J [Gemmatimonadota bacterium]MYA44187.1 NADH-quinone oxidoreductase subunit J [Gemmatimonadota bacterium]MYE94238.1 NADH-quinone oxidoreductase subunit J [Gemmatimonadota bacterium]MYJ12030.1 NADH-quinone oxidoreductase subunit J [Gemmatimonadota bacterium]